MSLTILFDQPPGFVYSENYTVSGHVQLTSDKDISLGLVSIDFAGRGEVTITRQRGTGKDSHTDTYHSKGYYFYYTTLLFQGTHTHKPGTYSWPFTFTFPTSASPGLITSPRGAGTFFDPRPPYRATDPAADDGAIHYLPSTFYLRPRKQIRYYLKACFQPAEGRMGFFHRGLESVCDIPFYHRAPSGSASLWNPSPGQFDPRNHMSTYTFTAEARSFSLLAPSLGRGTSWKDRWKSRLHTSSTPLARFRISASFPIGLPRDYPGVIPWTIHVGRVAATQDAKCEFRNEDVAVEKVCVRKIELVLRAWTVTRARGYEDSDRNSFALLLLDAAEGGVEVEVDHSEFFEGGEKSGEGMGMGIGRRDPVAPVDMGSWGQARLPRELAESFSTYNFAAFYTVSLKVSVGVGEEDVRCKLMEDVPFEVLSVS